MSKTLCITGYKPVDEKWEKMLSVYNSCVEAEVNIPEEVNEFFEWEDPNNKPGLSVDMWNVIEKYYNVGESGFELKIENIPRDVKVIRFYNS